MSDTHIWLSSAVVDEVLAGMRADRDEMRARIHSLERDSPDRPLLVEAWGVLEKSEQRLRRALTDRAGHKGAHRAPGETTQEWKAGNLPAMPRNRGQW